MNTIDIITITFTLIQTISFVAQTYILVQQNQHAIRINSIEESVKEVSIVQRSRRPTPIYTNYPIILTPKNKNGGTKKEKATQGCVGNYDQDT